MDADITGIMEELDLDEEQTVSFGILIFFLNSPFYIRISRYHFIQAIEKIRSDLEEFISCHVEESSEILKFFIGKPAKKFPDYEMIFETVIAQAARVTSEVTEDC